METLALLLLVTMQRNNTGVVSVSMYSTGVGLRHEVHYWVVWVYTEARTVLIAVMTDFHFNCLCL
jgi:hypothetical protein